MTRIEVRPFGPRSWSLTIEAPAACAPMLFRSGARAESAARLLAARLAGVGIAVEILIGLRDGSVAGRFVSGATPSPG